MANWREKLNQAAQNTISKSKEVAGVAKLNVEIASLNQSLKNVYTEVGKHVLENGLLAEDETVAEWASKAADIKAEIEENTEKIKLLKNVNTCPGCGAEVPRTSKFCDKCGTPIVVASTEPVKEDKEIIDAEYSEAQEDAVREAEPETVAESETGGGCCCGTQETPGED
ncbi:MAG: zinc ribbon domain-containing protein [Lachnospiraceae bacterium]|nr:zinc ribbon domain-containing protein [Lachnospiraceae bacterium]